VEAEGVRKWGGGGVLSGKLRAPVGGDGSERGRLGAREVSFWVVW
jgi:hypothetical protein